MSVSELMRDLEKGRPVKVSSEYSYFGAFVFLFIWSLMTLILLNNELSEFSVGFYIFYVLVFGLFFFQFKYISKVVLEGNSIEISKKFRQTERIEIKQIVGVSTFNLRKSKYTILKYQRNDNTTATALILNLRKGLFGEEDTLEDLLNLARKKFNK